MMDRAFIRTRIHREAVDSTSDLAAHLAEQGALAYPLLVSATRQTKGRGRGDHSWWSDPGSLTFTIVLDPAAHSLRAVHEARLALATAVAVIDAIAPLRPIHPPGIRWPNDIEANGRKLGGLLPERITTAGGTRLLALGVGLNVLTRTDDAPPEVRGMAAAVADITAVRPCASALLEAILERLEVVLGQLAEGDAALASRWGELDTLRDRWVRVDLGPNVVEGLGAGIDAEGALLVAQGREVIRLFGGQVLRP